MQRFKDAKNREWNLALTIGRARAVLDATGIDLLQPETGTPSLPEILADDYQVATILQVLLAGEFVRHGVDGDAVLDEDWDGATTRLAYDALLAELACFFEGRGQNPRAEIVRKTHAALAEALAIVGEKVDGLDPVKTVREQAAKQEAASTAGNTSGKPPDALASPLLL